MQPEMIKTPSGWLAVTPRNAGINIGVTAENPTQARERFASAMTAWEQLPAGEDAPVADDDEG